MDVSNGQFGATGIFLTETGDIYTSGSQAMGQLGVQGNFEADGNFWAWPKGWRPDSGSQSYLFGAQGNYGTDFNTAIPHRTGDMGLEKLAMVGAQYADSEDEDGAVVNGPD